MRRRVGILWLLWAACASAPAIRAASELSLTAAAEAWSVYVEHEAAAAAAEPEPARSARLDALARDNAAWDDLETAFDAAWAAYDAAERAGAVTLPDAQRRALAAHDRARAWLRDRGVLP